MSLVFEVFLVENFGYSPVSPPISRFQNLLPSIIPRRSICILVTRVLGTGCPALQCGVHAMRAQYTPMGHVYMYILHAWKKQKHSHGNEYTTHTFIWIYMKIRRKPEAGNRDTAAAIVAQRSTYACALRCAYSCARVLLPL